MERGCGCEIEIRYEGGGVKKNERRSWRERECIGDDRMCLSVCISETVCVCEIESVRLCVCEPQLTPVRPAGVCVR